MSEKSGAVFPSLTLCAKIGDTAAIAIADAIKKDFKYFMYEKITNMERKIKFKTPFPRPSPDGTLISGCKKFHNVFLQTLDRRLPVSLR